MQFMMPLRDSLKRTKDKWKSRFQSGTPSLAPPLTPAYPTSALQPTPAEHPSSNLASAACEEISIGPDSGPIDDQVPTEAISAWSRIRALLAGLEASSDFFGPLKLAISGLCRCVDIYECASDDSTEYNEVQKKLKEILEDISAHTNSTVGLVRTSSVQRIYSDIDAEAKRVAKKQARATSEKLKDALLDSDEILECYRRIAEHLQRLTLNVSLSTLSAVNEQAMELRLNNISPAKSAFYNSQDVKRGACAPGTRKAQIDLLIEWARTPTAGRTCWMNGMAGTGKTTIAYTVCDRLGNQLGASFFCSRTIPECRQVKHIIPTLAYRLARFSSPFRYALDAVLEADPDAPGGKLKQQYEKLVVEPLLKVQKSLPTNMIIVIDALDECEDPDSVGQILDLLLSQDYAIPIRFLVSSRPESQIYNRMANRTDGSPDEARLVLHDLDSEGVRSDIETYMRHELKGVTLTSPQWSTILDQCGVLFIYASTICRFIRQGHATDTIDELVETIMNSSYIPMTGENSIDTLYHTILAAAFRQDDMTENNTRRMKALLESVICAIGPMSLNTIAELLGLKSIKQVEGLLRPLRSVLNVAKDTGLVTTLHASFPDFMLSRDRSQDFSCDHATRHAIMAEACLRTIDMAEPKINICGLPSSYLLDSQVEDLDERVRQAISPGLAYACRHWSTHLDRGEYRDSLLDPIRRFFFDRLLLWMEVLNLRGDMRYGTGIVQDAERWCAKHSVLEMIVKMAHDAGQFVSVYANHPVCKSTPHIYVSMLPFWPRSRPMSAAYMPRTVGLIEPKGSAMGRRTLALLATWKASSTWIQSMSLSGDGTRLAVPTGDGIDMLDTTTGEIILSISNNLTKSVLFLDMSDDGSHVVFSTRSALRLVDVNNQCAISELTVFDDSCILCVAFSPNGSHVACGLENGEVHIWSLQPTVQHFGPLNGHTEHVTSVGFSSKGSHLASGSDDKTIRTWDVQTGQAVGHPLVGHLNPVTSVAHSPCDSRLASASNDMTIRVWDPQTRQSTLTIPTHHSGPIRMVAFSPSGAFIASGSQDITIRVFDAHTGHPLLGPLHGHTDYVRSVIFSPDSCRLFSCSIDGTVRMWDLQDVGAHDALLSASALSRPIYAVRYSRNGIRAVSGSDDGTIRFWDVSSCATNSQAHVESRTGGENVVASDPNRDEGLNWCSLDDDGWVVDRRNRRLVWVPPDLRGALAVPPNDTIIAGRGCLLDFTEVTTGETWAGCYRP